MFLNYGGAGSPHGGAGRITPKFTYLEAQKENEAQLSIFRENPSGYGWFIGGVCYVCIALCVFQREEMPSALQFQASNPRAIAPRTTHTFATKVHSHRSLSFTKRSSLPQPLCSFTVQPSPYTSTVGSSSLAHRNLTSRHVTVLNVFACAVPSTLSLNKSLIISYHSSINETCVCCLVQTAVCATWLFCSAIPTLLVCDIDFVFDFLRS